MISFLVNFFKLLMAIGYGIKTDDEFRILLYTLLVLLAGGSFFYWHVEGWTVLDALYFCVMTMSTIGYGDLAPTSPLAKGFTIVFSILSIGFFAAVGSKVVKIILTRREDRFGNHARRSRSNRPRPE